MSMREHRTSANTAGLESGDQEALEHLRRAVLEGAHWFDALLEAIALWRSPEETYRGVTYRYLVGSEAFDWLRLAERLTDEIADFVPARELEALLFHGVPPFPLDDAAFRRRIGPAKYRAHLNFFYGVVVEEALLLAAEEQLLKEGNCLALGSARRTADDPYLRVYGQSQADLLRQFQREQGRPAAEHLTQDELHEFTYWLFKYRLKWMDKARVASDTKKGLITLNRVRSILPMPSPAPADIWNEAP
jgi:hypothetical protein